ncbi:MAG: helix-turn-helix domain-containing protein [Anaerostipes hadrus]
MFGKRIRKLRLEQNLKQKDLAAKLGISTSNVGMYERELRQPDAEILKKIADFFNVSIDYILGNSDKRDHSELTYKDNRNIAKTLDMLKDQIDNNESGELNYNGIEVTDDDAELLMDALDMALRRIKKKNKEKYTPKKYKK